MITTDDLNRIEEYFRSTSIKDADLPQISKNNINYIEDIMVLNQDGENAKVKREDLFNDYVNSNSLINAVKDLYANVAIVVDDIKPIADKVTTIDIQNPDKLYLDSNNFIFVAEAQKGLSYNWSYGNGIYSSNFGTDLGNGRVSLIIGSIVYNSTNNTYYSFNIDGLTEIDI